MALPNADDLLKPKQEKAFFAKIILPFMLDGYKEGKNIAGEQGEGKATDTIDDAVFRKLKKMSLKNAAQAAKTSQKDLRRTINLVLEEDGTVDDLARAIKQQYAVKTRSRSILIARTELTGVIGNGTLDGLIEEGYEEVEWVTTVDGRQRLTHEQENGNVVKSGSDFNVGGKYPGDQRMDVKERVHCRCTIVGHGIPNLDDERMVKRNLAIARLFLNVHGKLERRFYRALAGEFTRQRDRILARL